VKRRGLLITLDGNEGCGKSTQLQLLFKALKKCGHKVFLTRDPGGTRVSDGIRDVLLDNKNKAMTPLCETLLYMASRAQLVGEVIRPKLDAGVIVLCDRWVDATVAYQGYAGGVNVDWIKTIGREATAGVKPAASVFLDLPLEAGLRRAKKRKAADRIEAKALSFHRKVRRGYEAIAKAEPQRFKRVRISTEDTAETVHAKILKALSHVL
jgi:dTMP kinase